MESGELRLLAEDVMSRLRSITDGAAKPDDPQFQEWATRQFARLDTIAANDCVLIDAVEDSLVDILSCDGASWDTTDRDFALALRRLEQLTADS